MTLLEVLKNFSIVSLNTDETIYSNEDYDRFISNFKWYMDNYIPDASEKIKTVDIDEEYKDKLVKGEKIFGTELTYDILAMAYNTYENYDLAADDDGYNVELVEDEDLLFDMPDISLKFKYNWAHPDENERYR